MTFIFNKTKNQFIKECKAKYLQNKHINDTNIDLTNIYIQDISSKRNKFYDDYNIYLEQYNNSSIIDKVNLFKNKYPVKPDNHHIYTHFKYPTFITHDNNQFKDLPKQNLPKKDLPKKDLPKKDLTHKDLPNKDLPDKECKRDCKEEGKICNKRTGRCIKIK